MSSPLRFNEALLITGKAFKPFQCVAWVPQEGNGELSVSILDRTSHHLGRAQLSSSMYSDPQQLAKVLTQSRADLAQQGFILEPWTMPE
jgi:hypothetical protein